MFLLRQNEKKNKWKWKFPNVIIHCGAACQSVALRPDVDKKRGIPDIGRSFI